MAQVEALHQSVDLRIEERRRPRIAVAVLVQRRVEDERRPVGRHGMVAEPTGAPRVEGVVRERRRTDGFDVEEREILQDDPVAQVTADHVGVRGHDGRAIGAVDGRAVRALEKRAQIEVGAPVARGIGRIEARAAHRVVVQAQVVVDVVNDRGRHLVRVGRGASDPPGHGVDDGDPRDVGRIARGRDGLVSDDAVDPQRNRLRRDAFPSTVWELVLVDGVHRDVVPADARRGQSRVSERAHRSIGHDGVGGRRSLEDACADVDVSDRPVPRCCGRGRRGHRHAEPQGDVGVSRHAHGKRKAVVDGRGFAHRVDWRGVEARRHARERLPGADGRIEIGGPGSGSSHQHGPRRSG